MAHEWVGKNVPRKEAWDKVTGKALYVDDLTFPDLLYGATIRSTIPHGKLLGVHFEGDIPWDEFVVVQAKDIPGKNIVTLIQEDQPLLADEIIHHAEEPVVLLAHPDKHLLEKARTQVRLEIEPLPAIHSLDESLETSEVIWGKDNIFSEYNVVKGDVDSVWDREDALIVEGEYRTGAQDQLYIETQGMIAKADEESGVTVWGSMQCPYYVQKAIGPLFDLPPEKVRIIQAVTGGGFGGKEEYPSMIAGHAALLAWKSQKPVKIIYDREEDLEATTKRHPARIRHKTAVTPDGKLLAMDIDFVIDGGAYITLSPVVLSRGTIHAAGPYLCDHVRIRSRAVATNTPPYGAFRGFGAPQSIFGLERQLDRIAKKLDMDPAELRRKNFIQTGESTAVSQVIREPVDMNAVLNKALHESGYQAKRRSFEKHNKTSSNTIRKGIGAITFYHGSGFTGSGEVYLASMVGLEATKEGKVQVLAASTEIGQGTNTIFGQIAADSLQVHYHRIEVAQPDTGRVPDSGPTVASRTCMVVGKLIEKAAEDLLNVLRKESGLPKNYTDRDFEDACRLYVEKNGPLKVTAQYEPPSNINWDEKKFQGDAYGAYSWAAYVAEVSVDTRTYEVKVDDFVAVQEVGKVVHPTLAAGQVEGGVAQGIGQAIYENVVWNEGRMANAQMTNYIMPTAADTPPIRVYFLETPYPLGPKGAKGLGELPHDGPAAAIASAVEHATGVPMNAVPITPERLMEAMEKTRGTHA